MEGKESGGGGEMFVLVHVVLNKFCVWPISSDATDYFLSWFDEF
jgi:hypothetical protein